MLQKLKELWTKWTFEGINFPYARDPVAEQPSVTLLSYYIMMMLSVFSLIFVHFKPDYYAATLVTLGAWLLSFIFYRIRKIDSFKLDVTDGEFEIKSKDDENE